MDEPIVSDMVLPSMQVELPAALQEPTRAKNLLFLLLFGVANMVIGVSTIAISSVLLPEHVASFVSAGQTTVFSLILGVGAVAAALTNPLAGMLSDRTTSRWGRRRPWLIAGGVLTVADLLMLSVAPSLLVVAIGWIVLQIATSTLQVALLAILPDQVPVHQRATVSAFAAGFGSLLGTLFGQIMMARFFTAIPAAYTSIAVTSAIMIALFLLVLRDVPLPRESVPPLHINHVFAMFKPLARRDFALVWVARCLIFLGYTTVVTFMFFFLQNAVHYAQLFPGQTTAQGVQTFFVINVASIIIASLIGGILSDKLLRRKLFVMIASVIMAVGLFLFAFFPTWSMVLVGTAVLGVGFGVFLAVDLALASQVLPAAADRGKDIGIIQAAIYIPTILSPVIAGITLGILHSYLALFSFLGVATLIAAVLIVPIKSVR